MDADPGTSNESRPALDPLNWRKASQSSSSGGECVEVADHDGTVLLRDTKQPAHTPIHEYTPTQWRTFITALKTT